MSDVFSQSGTARYEIYTELASLRLIDPHTHINPHSPASTTLADLLGYHYYTELAHSAGMPKSRIEDKSIGPKELVERLVGGLAPLENTVQYSWLIKICRTFFGFDEDRLHLNNWEALYDRSESIMSSAQWPDMVLDQSNVEAVFLTNDFDDDLAGFDTDRYIPCLRTDDLVFHLADPVVRERLAKCTGIELDGSLASLRASLRSLFEHFVGRGARACAISLPPTFTPTSVPDGRAATALDAVLRGGLTTDPSQKEALSRRVFWTLAELCDEFELPFDLMIGVNRKVYPEGVFQGQDLYDSRVSLIQYRDLFNTFPDVKFPVSVLASVTNQELVSYAWIFPNVYPNGHWWYSNTPSTITHDLAARLEAVPQTKMIGYYSDAYKLEFVWPKFDMYRKVLSGVLADQFVRDQGWSVERAVELGRKVLKDNTEVLFPRRGTTRATIADASLAGAAGIATVGIADEYGEEDLMMVEETQKVEDLGAISLESDDAASGDASSDENGEGNDDGGNDDGVIGAALGATGLAAVAAGLASEVVGDDSTDEDEKLLDGLDSIEDPTTGDLADIELIDPAPTMLEAHVVGESHVDDELSKLADSSEPLDGDNDDLSSKTASAENLAAEDLSGHELSDDDVGESFDTVVLDPNFAKTDQSESDAPSETASLVASESEVPDEFDTDEDLGRPHGDSDHLGTAALDSAATVVEEAGSGTIHLEDGLPLDESSAAKRGRSGSQVLDDSLASDELSLEELPSTAPEGESTDESSESGIEHLVSKVDDPEPVSLDDSEADKDESEPDVDPLPAEEELSELGLDDVELLDVANEPVHDAASIESAIDDAPLDVGDLTSDDDDDSEMPQIQQLRGESSFAPDDESLQLKPDPLTGELRFGATPPAEPTVTPGDGIDDDNDEFNLSWLDEDDDSDKIEG